MSKQAPPAQGPAPSLIGRWWLPAALSAAVHVSALAWPRRAPAPDVGRAPDALAGLEEARDRERQLEIEVESSVAVEDPRAQDTAVGSDDRPESPKPSPAPRPADHDLSRRARGAKPTSRKGQAAKSASAGTAALYGATDERGAVDLATTVVRLLPQATSGDPAWESAPFGSAGRLTLTVEIGPDGRATALHARMLRGSTGGPLVSAVRRLRPLISSRALTAPGRTVSIELAASIVKRATTIESGERVFALGWNYEAPRGRAYFSLTSGRTITIDACVTWSTH